ncbi:FIG00470476: hypothetical protein [hydrothermal vent metagenome]|uniref:Uncharacterized protein n=1 Tax=hydrothermal vent metagenome TaxID=652676 RepID=A0A1W1CKE0_9ZZZZ
MAKRKGGKSLFSLSTLLASFFGAAMIAGAFAYFNYKFSEYKFIDFKKWSFYEKSDIFLPKAERYIVIFYSSRQKNSMQKLLNLKLKTHILAIDYYNQIHKNSKNIIFLRAGTNTSLQFIQRFNIYKVPSLFFIKRIKETLYKQDSMIHKLNRLENIKEEKYE